jgi:hypothetical protein
MRVRAAGFGKPCGVTCRRAADQHDDATSYLNEAAYPKALAGGVNELGDRQEWLDFHAQHKNSGALRRKARVRILAEYEASDRTRETYRPASPPTSVSIAFRRVNPYFSA